MHGVTHQYILIAKIEKKIQLSFKLKSNFAPRVLSNFKIYESNELLGPKIKESKFN